MEIAKFFLPTIILTVIFSLSSCGGGSNTSTPKPVVTNQKPTVSANDITVNESDMGSLVATASDPDGSIVSYSWSQKTGVSINLATTDTSTVTFDAPEVKQDSIAVFTVVVTDNSGATASTDVSINILSNRVNLNISGIITDSPVANANVLVKIDDVSFTTIADSSGQYQINLDVDDYYLNKIVNITATGAQSDSNIKLKSILGSFKDLINEAGGDKTLTSNENFAVNVTNVSSALAVVMEEANLGNQINDVTEYEKSLKSYDNDAVFSLALVQKLILDYSSQSAELSLPANYSNVFDFIKDKKAAGIFLNNAYQKFFSTVNTAIQAIQSDENVVSTGNNKIPIADSYFFKTVPGLGRLILNNDGTGTSIWTSDVNINWIKTNEGLIITYPNGGGVENIKSFVPSVIEQRVTQKKLKWLQHTEASDFFVVESTYFDHYTDGSQPDSPLYTRYAYSQAIKSKGIVDAHIVLSMGDTYSISLPGVELPINNLVANPYIFTGTYKYLSAKINFAGDIDNGGTASLTVPVVRGDGNVTEQVKSLSWSIDAKGHVKLSGELNYDVVFLNAPIGKPGFVNVEETLTNSKVIQSGYVLKKESSGWNAQNVPGVYVLQPFFTGPLNLFWLELKDDGTALTVSTLDKNNDGVITDDEFDLLVQGLWQIDPSGKLLVRRYRSNTAVGGSGNYCKSTEFAPADGAACVLYNERILDLYQVTQDNKYFVTNTHKFYEDAFRADIIDAPATGNILQLFLLDNRYWQKMATSPVPIPPSLLSTAGKVKQYQLKKRPDTNH